MKISCLLFTYLTYFPELVGGRVLLTMCFVTNFVNPVDATEVTHCHLLPDELRTVT